MKFFAVLVIALLTSVEITSFDIQGKSDIWTKLFIATGNPSPDDVEIVDLLSDNASHCPKPRSYPASTYGTFGAFLNGTPTICGGDLREDRCYVYFSKNDSWIGLTLMSIGRWTAAAATTLDGTELWITGGFNSGDPEDSGSGQLKSSEILTGGVEGTRRYLDLPQHMDSHSLIRINESHLLLVPGYPYSNATWMIDLTEEEEEWQELAGPLVPRRGAFAGLVEGVGVVLAGGTNGFLLASTEIFDLDNLTWGEGPVMPVEIAWGASVQFNGSLLAIGGNVQGLGVTGQILRFDSSGWTQMEQKLQTPRDYFSAFLIPDQVANCTRRNEWKYWLE